MRVPSPRPSPSDPARTARAPRVLVACCALLIALVLTLAATGTTPARAAGPAFSASTIGEDPAAPGVFRFPQGVGVDPRNGTVFVADQYSGVIQAFDPTGVPRFAFGGHAERGEPGRLGVVGGVAVDRSGRVFVLDSEHGRVQVFSADDGRYLTTFGEPGTFAVDTTVGRPDGGISSGGIAVGQQAPGRTVVVFVADSGHDRVLRYALDPSSLRPYGAPRSTESAGLTVKRPQGVGLDASGERLYIPDNQNHRVLVVQASNFASLGSAGSFGAGRGQFQFPYDVAVDGRNQVYVGDNINGRVGVFDAFSLELLGTYGGNGHRVGRFSIVRAVATNPFDPAGGVYVADTANNRIQKLSADGVVTAAWGIAGRGPGYFTRPRGVAFRGDGTIAVADTFAHRVALLDPDGTYSGMLGRVNKVNGFAAPGNETQSQLVDPGAVVYDAQGGTWVADTYNDRLVRFDGGGTVVAATIEGALSRPRGLAAGGDGTVLATDSGGGRLVRVGPDGAVSTVRSGLNRPAAVALRPDGTAVVAAARLVIDDATGKRIAPPSGPYWDRPQGLAFAVDGTLYVSEARPKTPGGARVLRGTPLGDGRYAWDTVAGEGSDVGQVSDPANLALSPDGRTLLVADAGNSRVQRFDLPGAAPPARQSVQVAVAGGLTLGTVKSSPPGIDCGTDCSQLVGTDRVVTLTARPTPTGRFVGWTGDCAAAGAAPVCVVAASRTIGATATFQPVPPPPVKLGKLALTTTRWHLARKKVRATKGRNARKAVAATKAGLAVPLSQDARVLLQVQQQRPGRTVGTGADRRCVRAPRPDRVKRAERCTRWALLPTTRTLRLVAGTTTVDVRPRFPRRTLVPGLYRLRATAVDAQRNRSVRHSKRIRVTR